MELPSVENIIDGRVSIDDIREVQVEDILGGKIPDLQWKKALKEFKEMVIGYAQTPKATAKGWYEGFTAKPKKKEKKGGSVKTSKYSKGGGVRKSKYSL